MLLFFFLLLQHSSNNFYYFIVFIHRFFASADNIVKVDLVKSFLCFFSILYKTWYFSLEMAIGACFGVPPFFSRRKHTTTYQVFSFSLKSFVYLTCYDHLKKNVNLS